MQTFSTNEICELCQVSRKQLRYYEEKGLLSQVPRHSGNNYRYYTHEHIYEIVAAKAMRDIDMPLGEMKDIIYGRNVASIQNSLQQQMDSAKEALEICLRHYEQSMAAYNRDLGEEKYKVMDSLSGDLEELVLE